MRPTSWRSPGGFGEDLVTLPIRNGVDLAMPIVSFLLPQPSSHQGAQFGAADMRLHGLVEARQKKHALLPQAKCPKHRQVHCVTTVWQPAPDCEPTSERVEEVDAHFGNVNLCLEA